MSTEVTGEITVRVRYSETDAMGTVHHANYFVYFEQARTDLLRTRGVSYRQVEEMGFLLVLTRVAARLLKPVHYDDDLRIRTTVRRTTMVRIDHGYEVFRAGELVAEGESTLACIDREGRPQALPEFLQPDRAT